MSNITQEWSGRLTVSDPLTLVNEIARRYETLERVFMEYVDNSLDDADDMAKNNNGIYPYHIKIKVIIDKNGKKVTIIDNCRGMQFSILSRIVHNIGESNKRACPWLNGRFGFGVHAFRGFAKEIEFQTKNQNDNYYVLKLNRDEETVNRPIVKNERFPTDTNTGTIVTLKGFDEDLFEGLTVELIKEEIETHFETLLKKEDLNIEVNYVGDDSIKCLPFNYEQIPGKVFNETKRIEYKGQIYNVDIFLKVTDIITHRKPRFFSRGRRINFIKEDKSFIGKSRYRTAVWDHNNLTGYIEVGDIVSPVITRDGFVRGKNRTLLYGAILEFEEQIKEKLDEINQRYQDNNFNQLEDAISRALRKLAREDALRFRSEFVGGNGEITLQEGGGSTSTVDVGGPTGTGDGNGNGGGAGEGKMNGPTGDGEGQFQGHGTGGPLPNQGPSEYSGTTRKSFGFNIKFVNLPPDVDGQVLRSQFSNGYININMQHPDFCGRIERTRIGELKVTHRLLSYIAAVTSIYYKDQYYEKYHNQPDVRTELFDQQVEFIFRLESILLPFLRELRGMIISNDAGEEHGEET